MQSSVIISGGIAGIGLAAWLLLSRYRKHQTQYSKRMRQLDDALANINQKNREIAEADSAWVGKQCNSLQAWNNQSWMQKAIISPPSIPWQIMDDSLSESESTEEESVNIAVENNTESIAVEKNNESIAINEKGKDDEEDDDEGEDDDDDEDE